MRPRLCLGGLVALCVSAASGETYLSFQRTTDVIGVASSFDADGSLPLGNVTISIVARLHAFRKHSAYVFMSNWDFSMRLAADNAAGINFDGKTFEVPALEGVNVNDWHRYTISYDKGRDVLSLRVDDALRWNTTAEKASSSTAGVFGPGAIETIYFGQYGSYADGAFTRLHNDFVFLGALRSVAIWANAIAEGSPAIRYEMNTSSTLKNLGAAGARYDGVSGGIAAGDTFASSFVNEADAYECSAFSATLTSPTLSDYSLSSRPRLDNATYELAEDDSFEFLPEGFDDAGMPMRYSVVSLPPSGTLYEVDVSKGADDVLVDAAPYEPTFVFSRSKYVPSDDFDGSEIADFYSTTSNNRTSKIATLRFVIAYPVDDLPSPSSTNVTLDQFANASFVVASRDEDTAHTVVVVASLPVYGDLYVTHEGATTLVSAPFEPSTRVATFDQYASAVHAVSTFWPSSKDVENGEGVLYPRWHPNQILGPGDAPDAWGDSDRAYCPSTLQGGTGYAASGYTEFIEIEIDEAVYVTRLEIGENRGMGSITSLKAWDAVSETYSVLWADDADARIEAEFRRGRARARAEAGARQALYGDGDGLVFAWGLAFAGSTAALLDVLTARAVNFPAAAVAPVAALADAHKNVTAR
ncbi:hypothetical protein JL722_14965 [Aureococcus anophagefferens]|nr:hypothetical protein JL722_14965 [Aureococcus anophagefferens]